MTDRPKPGPADDETRRKKLREELDKPSRAEGVAPRAKKPVPKKKSATLRNLLDPNTARERSVGEEGDTLSDAVDRGVEMGTKAEKKRK